MSSTKEAFIGKFLSTAANEASMGMKLYGEQLARTGMGKAISGGVRGGRQAAASHVSPRMMGPIENLADKYRKATSVATGTGIGALGPARFNRIARKANNFALEAAESAGQPSVGGAAMNYLKKMSEDHTAPGCGYENPYLTKDASFLSKATGYLSSVGQKAQQGIRGAAQAERQAGKALASNTKGLYQASRQAGSNPLKAAYESVGAGLMSSPTYARRLTNYINPNKVLPPGVPTPGGAATKGLGAIGNVFKVAEAPEKTAAPAGVERLPSGQIRYRGEVFPGYNKPKNAPKGSKHKKRVLAKKGDKVKVVNFGARGYKHNYSAKAKKSYLARSAGIKGKDDKFSANYWSRRVLWPRGQKADGRSKKSSMAYGLQPYYGSEKIAKLNFIRNAASQAAREASTGMKLYRQSAADSIRRGFKKLPLASDGTASVGRHLKDLFGSGRKLHEGTLRQTLIDAGIGGTVGAVNASDGNRLNAALLGGALSAAGGRIVNNQARKIFGRSVKRLKPAALPQDTSIMGRLIKDKLNPIRHAREGLYNAIARPGELFPPGMNGIRSAAQTVGLGTQMALGAGLGTIGLVAGSDLGLGVNLGKGAGALFNNPENPRNAPLPFLADNPYFTKNSSYLGLPKKKMS